METLTVGSLFSGIGGKDLGLERAGMKVEWQVEIDPYCNEVLVRHWPDTPRFGDIRGVGAHNLTSVDLICGGFPCQPFSHAGQRRGTDDNRYLWPEMLRVVRELGPTYVVAENVYGLVTNEGGVVLETVVADLARAGYEVAPPLVFPAAALGAVHRRDRVWICAYAGHNRRRAKPRQQQEERPEVADRLRTPRPSGRRAVGLDPNSDRSGLEGWPLLSERAGQRFAWEGSVGSSGAGWEAEPTVGRLVDGVSVRMDEPQRKLRLAALGNAVVSHCAEMIGRALLDAHEE